MTVTFAPAADTAAVEVRDDVARPDTDAYVAAHAEGTPYHHAAWLDVVAAAFGHRTRYLAAVSANGRVCGVLPLVFFNSRLFGRFTVSVPFFNYGGVLADTPDIERALLDRAIAETKAAGGSHLELRHTRQHFTDLVPKRHKVGMDLPLAATVDSQWAGLDRKLRNQVRKAEKSGLTAVSGGAELLPGFYAVFARHMRDLGTPVYGVRFFREILSAFPRTSRIFTVLLKGSPVASALVHWHGTTIEVPWAAALRAYNPLCANVFLYWQMACHGIAHGHTTFDLGRSSPDAGTFHFKKQWGAEPRELVWEYWTAEGHTVPALNPGNPTFGLAIRAWQRLPVPVATALGPRIVRNIP